MSIARFIVSTGRCGSSLLSRLLDAHPDVLSLSEVFAASQPRAFPSGEVSADRFWDILSRPEPAWTAALQHRFEPDEFAYPIDEGGRFDRQSGVAPISAVCLPRISIEPDLLFSELEALVPTFPTAEIGVLYRALFDWLADRLGSRVWVERSGGSLAYCGEIARHFPDARFVHLYRDGCETALSMSRHPFFRLAVVREMLTRRSRCDPFDATGPFPDPKNALRAVPLPLEVFGRRWSAVILHGTGALMRQHAAVLHVRYEDLVSTPISTVRDVCDFLGLPEPSKTWLAWAATQPTAVPRRVAALTGEELERLQRACEPGERWLRDLRALARSG